MNGIGWFSGGVTSAVAIKKALELKHSLVVIYFETGAHHVDHERFIADCEKWYNQKIIVVRNKKYKNLWDVLEKHHHLNSPYGADCTNILKKEMRQKIEGMIDFDFQVFGFEYEKRQIKRAERFKEQYPDSKPLFPLIDMNLNKKDCMEILINNNIDLPQMYKLGYSNSNCIGCVKGGMGYWNKIRIDFPEVFEKMCKIERKHNRSCINGTFLDELNPLRGRHEDISLPECGVVCPVEMFGDEIT